MSSKGAPDSKGAPKARGAAAWVRSIVARSIVLGVVWLAMTEADPYYVAYGPAVVGAAVVVSLVLTRGPGSARLGFLGLLRRLGATVSLAGWVVWRSIVGGIDVARRAVALPRADIDPSWTTVAVSAPSSGERVALALVMNLMPGTLSASVSDEGMDVHLISPDFDVADTVAQLERRIGAIARP